MPKQQTDQVTELETECGRLEREVLRASTILDLAMGDTDVEGDDSPMFRAHVILIRVALDLRKAKGTATS